MTQAEMVVKYMKEFGSISTMEAFNDLGITRLASRIHEISKVMNIERIPETGVNRYGERVHYTRYKIGA